MNTRFRPTPYRDLHAGHVWVAWHNWDMAARSGGRFLMIADDIVYDLQHLGVQSWPAEVAVQRFAEDLAWLGMEPEVHLSSEFADLHRAAEAHLGYKPPLLTGTGNFLGDTILDPDWQRAAAAGQYLPWFVAIRVVDDAALGVNGFVRGADLIGELQLYDDIARRLNLNPPGQRYVPSVRRAKSTRKESKSSGGVSIRDMREVGYTPKVILDTLRECADRSAKAGLADVVIPDGVLELEPVRGLTWRKPREALKAQAEGQAGMPWGDVATRYCKQLAQWAEREGV
jgi:glutamyl/glutaminyl-tRNA synthetase